MGTCFPHQVEMAQWNQLAWKGNAQLVFSPCARKIRVGRSEEETPLSCHEDKCREQEWRGCQSREALLAGWRDPVLGVFLSPKIKFS